MKLLRRTLLSLALVLGTTTAAQAATFNCAYIITSEPGSSGWHTVESDRQDDALNQTIAWIYETFGPVGFQLKCYQQP
ncbi:hypothetical protein C1924_13975 [Stenotrophomonas sp. ESTM1D_MKCIP4_1]|uniref:hypothetical protein n=1 Tax=Stenotrophomonas sp. ESTM1D_MKCIP4_1 TaxID=2072414 RepID=UPI000D53EA50|nr:hypothetical protein [Stenotrophomonas sp. ESTM1D_MKCIP4_1]AWH54209.1 hypothetical protein C1924_13975 [Stenotrophomonas sp. ESTM1D_MKCIP4_1]